MRVRHLIEHARPYRGWLALLVVLTTLSALVMLAVPWLAGQMLGGIVSGSAAGLDRVAGLLVLCLVAVALLSLATAYQSTSVAAGMLSDLRQRLFEHLQRLKLSYHDAHSRGDLLALLALETTRLSQFLAGTLVALPSRLLVALGAFVLMFRIDPALALVVPLLIPAFYLILKLVGRRLRGLAVGLQQANAEVVAVAEQMLDMLPATKAFTREPQLDERFRVALDKALALQLREGRIYAALEPLIGLVAAIAAVAVLLLAGRGLQAGETSPAELFSFIFYAALLTRPVGALANVYGQVQTARGTLARLHAVLDEPVEDVRSPGRSPARLRGEIRFAGVHFAYPGRERVLAGVDLAVAAGETVALIGPNGAGKTAMINLLLRFYEPEAGLIAIDGRDIREMDVTELRRQVGLVPQTSFLFNGTIRENIAFGSEAPTARQIEDAARTAQAFEFIMALPEGMDTRIGDRGLRLSGGQRQRISLARALIADPPILLLDEATSMFDDEGESGFIAASADALEARTVILITHRPATLALADRIVLLEDGRLSEPSAAQIRLATASA